MQFHTGKPIAAIALGALAALGTSLAFSQATPSGTPPVRESRIDLFAGYSYLHPVSADINKFYDQPITTGALFSVAGYLNRYVGVQAEGGLHPSGPNDCVFTAQAGPIVRYQMRRFVPFAHALGGGAKLGGPVLQPCTWGYGVTGGIGLDYVLPQFHDHFAIRPIQADYNYNHVDYGPLVNPGGYAGGEMKMNAYALAAGVVYRIGDMTPPLAAALSCVATPGIVFAGDPITITSNTVGLNPKRHADYTWTSNGGKITGSGETVQVSTVGLDAGSYAVNGRVSQGSKTYQQATCSAEFQVKAIEPPTLTCSANPTSIHANETSTITSVGVSPQNRPLTYSFSASTGQISGQSNIATLQAPAGAQPGSITVTCNVVDDKGQTAQATTSVQVIPTEIQPVPQPRSLCSLSFDQDKKRPVRVDNKAKGCLDDVYDSLKREVDSRLVLTGNAAAGETADMAAERASNAKLYLTREKGIDAGRITLRTGTAGTRTVTTTLLPTGATADDNGTQPVIESSVAHHGQPYGTAKAKTAPHKRHHRRK